ncbi:hypothetical protein HAX54_022636, partial [Datura stramonium]|nr:hypothetical protein [Datura stramonium]
MSSTCGIRSLLMLGIRGRVLSIVTLTPHLEVGFLERVSDHLLVDQFRQLFSCLMELILDGVTIVGDRVPKGILRYIQAIE